MSTGQAQLAVVEDDDSMREAIVRLLGAAGLKALAFASAEELLASAASVDAACVISDLMLPEKSGLELLGELRARQLCTPMILITAYDAPGLREEALRRGAAAFLTKPFRGAELLEAVRAALPDAA